MCTIGSDQHSTCRASRGATQDEALRLRERDVAAVRQRGDAQAAAVADVLIVVFDLRITDIHLHSSVLSEAMQKQELV